MNHETALSKAKEIADRVLAPAARQNDKAHTPMGVKGCGEVGTIGSPAAVTNAVVDALSPYGVSHIDMPATPNRIWPLIHSSPLLRAVD
jgi:CO/xanthine dehydrogenase Mo-binding subunit